MDWRVEDTCRNFILEFLAHVAVCKVEVMHRHKTNLDENLVTGIVLCIGSDIS